MPNQGYVEDEINLVDYIKVILKKKKLILSIFFVAVITTTIISFRLPKIYESTSTIKIGNIGELLINKAEAREMLVSQNLLEPIIKKLNLDVGVKQLKKKIKIEDIEDTNLLRIKVKYHNPDIAVKINRGIVSSFISQGQAIYQERLSLINERLRELGAEVKNTEEDIRRTQNLIAGLSSSTAISQQDISLRIILLQNTLSSYKSYLYTLHNQRNELKISLSKVKDFKVIETPRKPKYPLKPNKKQNIVIAGIVSLMFGTFLAFFDEYWEKSKK